MRLLFVWLLNAIALIAVPYVLPAIHVANFSTALIAALVLGLVNAVIRPILVILTLPVTFLTLGLFIFVINGLMFWLVGSFVQGFVVHSLSTAILGALVYSVLSWALASLLLKDQ